MSALEVLELLCRNEISPVAEILGGGSVGFRVNMRGDTDLVIELSTGDVYTEGGFDIPGKRHGVGDVGLYRALESVFNDYDPDSYPPTKNGCWRALHRFLIAEFGTGELE